MHIQDIFHKGVAKATIKTKLIFSYLKILLLIIFLSRLLKIHICEKSWILSGTSITYLKASIWD